MCSSTPELLVLRRDLIPVLIVTTRTMALIPIALLMVLWLLLAVVLARLRGLLSERIH